MLCSKPRARVWAFEFLAQQVDADHSTDNRGRLRPTLKLGAQFESAPERLTRLGSSKSLHSNQNIPQCVLELQLEFIAFGTRRQF